MRVDKTNITALKVCKVIVWSKGKQRGLDL